MNVILTAARNRLHHTKVNQELYINYMYNTAFLSERITKACLAAQKPEDYYKECFTVDLDLRDLRDTNAEEEATCTADAAAAAATAPYIEDLPRIYI